MSPFRPRISEPFVNNPVARFYLPPCGGSTSIGTNRLVQRKSFQVGTVINLAQIRRPHGPEGEFTVKIKATDHPVTKGVKDFKTEDEPYAKRSGDAKIELLAMADSQWSGETEPIVFTKFECTGRALQNVLGHGIDAKQKPAYGHSNSPQPPRPLRRIATARGAR